MVLIPKCKFLAFLALDPNIFSLDSSLTMNRLINGQRLYIIECHAIQFFIEKLCSDTKIIFWFNGYVISRIVVFGVKIGKNKVTV